MLSIDLFPHTIYTSRSFLENSDIARRFVVSQKVVSFISRAAIAGATAVIISGQAVAEDRTEVLERIRPVGQVAVTGQPAPKAPAAAPAPAAQAAAPAPAPAAPALAAPAAPASEGASLYAAKGCIACHGADANSPIMPAYPKLGGLPSAYTLNQLKDIKSGARNNGQTAAMKGIMASVSDAEMKVLADWLYEQKR
jgi:cytochrome c553